MIKIFALFIITSLPTLVIAQVNQPASGRPLVFRNVTVIDMQSSRLQPQMTVVIVGSRITALGKTVRVPNKAEVVDGSGKFMIPGLWDMHVHIFNNSFAAGTNDSEILPEVYFAIADESKKLDPRSHTKPVKLNQ